MTLQAGRTGGCAAIDAGAGSHTREQGALMAAPAVFLRREQAVHLPHAVHVGSRSCAPCVIQAGRVFSRPLPRPAMVSLYGLINDADSNGMGCSARLR